MSYIVFPYACVFHTYMAKQFVIKKIHCRLKQEIVKFLNESGVVVSKYFKNSHCHVNLGYCLIVW